MCLEKWQPKSFVLSFDFTLYAVDRTNGLLHARLTGFTLHQQYDYTCFIHLLLRIDKNEKYSYSENLSESPTLFSLQLEEVCMHIHRKIGCVLITINIYNISIHEDWDLISNINKNPFRFRTTFSVTLCK